MSRVAEAVEKDFVAEHSQELFERYPGKYLALVDNEIVAVGRSMLEVFKRAEEKYPNKLIRISYIPREDELVMLL
ncbi:MAG: hypothetical protein J7J17_00325 [Hadesarchaea archaeon]|nr:hypothetical protein [Hadesarchaea archaeon]